MFPGKFMTGAIRELVAIPALIASCNNFFIENRQHARLTRTNLTNMAIGLISNLIGSGAKNFTLCG